jgi:protein-S-isoprenylcysteine O-methyltransferase Ste14
MHAVDLALGLGWLAFWVYWLTAALGVKSGRPAWGRFAGVRLLVVLAVVALLQTHALRARTAHSAWSSGLGLALFAPGLGVAVWARICLGSNWGGPMSEKDEPELVTTGPYRWVRNPIYTGLILAMTGTAIAVNVSWLVVVAVLGGYFVYSAFVEQRFLEARFPDQYAAYKRSTKMLVPFLF